MYTKAEIQHLARKYRIVPSRERGQNFLVDPHVVEDLFAAADLQASDKVLEVGAGLGVVTVPLAQRCAQVVAVEVDRLLEPPLRLLEQQHSNLHIVRNDVLKCSLGELMPERVRPYKIIASLPFNITSHFIQKVLTDDVRPQTMTLIIQYEVAERIVAEPGKMSLLSLSCQLYSRPQLVRKIPSFAFWPEPDVDAAIIHFADIQEPDAFQENAGLERRVFHLAHAAFSGKRKQLRNTLAGTLHLDKAATDHLLSLAGIDPQARPQELSIEQWIALARVAEKQKN